ncbi:MAG TPA: hypothetical protein VK609_01455, partial [Mucilaginibacter sp.]|nr:hypothetical protein [Mucilaginibacter sp.]
MKSIILSSKLIIVLFSALAISALSCGNSNSSKQPAKEAAKPPKAASISNLLSEQQFNDLFPQRDKFYTYA